MFKSYPVFRAFGIPISIHGSLFILLPFFALAASGAGTLSGFLAALLLMALLFGCVLLHELGHAVAALALREPSPTWAVGTNEGDRQRSPIACLFPIRG